MALNDKKYEKFYKTDGTGDDKAKAADIARAEELWDLDRAKGCEVYLNHPDFAPLIFQLQQMQDELDALRTEIALNKDKSTFPGIGTSGSTCLAGNTTTISTSQASAITANTAKTGISTSQASAITANTSKVSFPFTGNTPYAGGSVSTATFTHNTKNNTLVITVTIPAGPLGKKQPAVTKSVTLILQ